MTPVTIHKCTEQDSMPQTVLEKVHALTEAVQRRAFDLFEHRTEASGSELEDWLQAERDMVWVPPSELLDSGKELRARIALPGFDAKEVEVCATAQELLVRAETGRKHQEHEGTVALCEFANKTLFRRFDLPSRIDVNKISASLENGILQITAPKTREHAALAA